VSSVVEIRPDEPSLPDLLRGMAKTLDGFGVLLLRLAERAEATEAPDPFLTVEEAAAELRCSERHISEACRRGRLVAMLDARAWKIRRSELELYERRRTTARSRDHRKKP
jgi:excisionase family DNA binding protein